MSEKVGQLAQSVDAAALPQCGTVRSYLCSASLDGHLRKAAARRIQREDLRRVCLSGGARARV
ncbi:hypothetical protein QSH46_015460 [Xanthomonas arboricola pv. juglandis]|uniref:hypothetical protein n=1 Tax=Xanthomonas arboricola TaxID=56448 RepID=UPI000A72347E|nr:hypothetical protein [Xanthomonas arboricola]MDN0204208.1 hypothetical protein [Xanthomonas arboricola pv. corylina]MDN0217322.1 hypothetical protein [Xanthomonas arboricola pv. corylina]MDN0221378.1 hypothetical protein [Xanthomonas arboricola pv. juglandis]MDN0225652.1 hypothetical protein [Xanthomonas arboricola pv. juglandis]MDN0229954.1 hypothetical protein [Xanthomonas arboricola pv. juglandis]